MTKKPLIGLTATTFPPDPNRVVYGRKPIQSLEVSGTMMISQTGGLPLMLPNTKDPADLKQMIDTIDGLILSGGTDVAPSSYKEKPISERWPGDRERDEYELTLLDLALKERKPVLGLCRGIQVVNVYFGGTLYQDISTQKEGSLKHRDADLYDKICHPVRIENGSLLYSLYKKEKIMVNSVHHQGIKDLGKGLKPIAYSEDGLIEAVEPEDPSRYPFLLAVQWHPEWSPPDHPITTSGEVILKSFLEAC